MELVLNRIAYRDTYTIGKLFINGVLFSDCIEDRNRDLNHDGDLNDDGEGKVYSETCIPFGKYEVIVNYSPKFKRFLPRLLNVPSFEGILIHNGTSEKSSAGCIIVGENKTVGKVTNSTYYMNKLTDLILAEQKKGLKTTIVIK